MTETPFASKRAQAWAMVLPTLVIFWVAALAWLWVASEGVQCDFHHPSPGVCPYDPAEAQARFNTWFPLVFAAGPLLVLAAWTTINPNGRRYLPAMWLLGVVWICASPLLFLYGSFEVIDVSGYAPDDPAPPEPERPLGTLQFIAGAAGMALTPAAMSVIAFKSGRPVTGSLYAVFAALLTAIALLLWPAFATA